MELSCYDPGGSIFASPAFLNLTAVFIILAAFAVARLMAMSRADSLDQLRFAPIQAAS
ncbi:MULTISPECIES: hypothetical protein [unclassified Mesorhizobium]|uniref:hypothetical protein n=1 Tax=unclassified Mesorhizobium TaxID=325217 RepID=UPI0015C70599|nr:MULTISPECIES: hypothetical protein [unclassified Mesorhizobium]